MGYLGQTEILGVNPGATTQSKARVTTTNQLLTASELVDASGNPLKIDSTTA